MYQDLLNREKNKQKNRFLNLIKKVKFQKQFFKNTFFPVDLFYFTLFPSFHPIYLSPGLLHFFLVCLQFVWCLYFAYLLPFPWFNLPLKMLSILFTPNFLGCPSFLICQLPPFVVGICCNSAPVISSSCVFSLFTSVHFTSCPPTFHSHLLLVVIFPPPWFTSVCIAHWSVMCFMQLWFLLISKFMLFFFLDFLVIVHLFRELFFYFPVLGW